MYLLKSTKAQRLYSVYLHCYAKSKLLFSGFVFCEHINKSLLLRRQAPGCWHTGSRRFTALVATVTMLTHLFNRFCTYRHCHIQPQYFQARRATTSQNRAETRKTASQALRLSAGSLCGSSLPAGIANLIQSISLIILRPNNWYN